MLKVVIPIALVILAALIFFIFTTPLIAEIDGLRLANAKLEQGLAAANKQATLFQEKSTRYDAVTKPDRDLLNYLLPDSLDEVDVLLKLSGLARLSGATLGSVKIKREEARPRAGQTLGALGTVTFDFTITAPYANFKQFLGNLERSLRLVDMTGISFSTADKEGLSYNLEFKTYWLR